LDGQDIHLQSMHYVVRHQLFIPNVSRLPQSKDVGLADALRSELLLYDIDVHIFFPPTMYTPGYEEENKTKPTITLKIEEGDPGLSAEQGAQGLLRGDRQAMHSKS
jgi:hypothetical protein